MSKEFNRRKEYKDDDSICPPPSTGVTWGRTDLLQCEYIRQAYNNTLPTESSKDYPSTVMFTNSLQTSFKDYQNIINKENGQWVYLVVNLYIKLQDYIKEYDYKDEYLKTDVGEILGEKAYPFMRGLYYDKTFKSEETVDTTMYQIVGKYPIERLKLDSEKQTIQDLTTKDINENPCTRLTNLRLQSYWARVLLELYNGRKKTDDLYPHLPDQMFRPFTYEDNDTSLIKDKDEYHILFEHIKNDCAFQNKSQYIKEMYNEVYNPLKIKKGHDTSQLANFARGRDWFDLEDGHKPLKINKLTLGQIKLTEAGKKELGFRRRRAILKTESLKCFNIFEKDKCAENEYCSYNEDNQVCLGNYNNIDEEDYEKFQLELKEHEEEYKEYFDDLKNKSSPSDTDVTIRLRQRNINKLKKEKAERLRKIMFKYSTQERTTEIDKRLMDSNDNLYKITQKAVDALDSRCHMMGSCSIPAVEGQQYRQKGMPFTSPFFKDTGNPFVPICCKRSLKLDLKRALMYDRFQKELNIMTPAEAKIELENTTLPDKMKKQMLKQSKKDNQYMRAFSAGYSEKNETNLGFDMSIDMTKLYSQQLKEHFGITLDKVSKESEKEEENSQKEKLYDDEIDGIDDEEYKNITAEYEDLINNESTKYEEFEQRMIYEDIWETTKTAWNTAKWLSGIMFGIGGTIVKTIFSFLKYVGKKGLDLIMFIFRNPSVVLGILQVAIMLKKQICAFISRTIFGDAQNISMGVFEYTTEMMGDSWNNIVEFGPSFSLLALDKFMNFLPTLLSGVASSLENVVSGFIITTGFVPLGVMLKSSGIISKSIDSATPFMTNILDSYLQTKILQQCLTDFKSLITMDNCVIQPEPIKTLRGAATVNDLVSATIKGTKDTFSNGIKSGLISGVVALPTFAVIEYFNIQAMSEPISKIIPQKTPSEAELKVAAIEGQASTIDSKKKEILENREIRKKCNNWLFACKTDEMVLKEEEDNKNNVLGLKTQRVQSDKGVKKEYDIIMNDVNGQLEKKLKELGSVRDNIVKTIELQEREDEEHNLTILDVENDEDFDNKNKTHVMKSSQFVIKLDMLNSTYSRLYVEMTKDRIGIMENQIKFINEIITKLKGDFKYSRLVETILIQAKIPSSKTRTDVVVYSKPSPTEQVNAANMSVIDFTNTYSDTIYNSSKEVKNKNGVIINSLIGWENVRNMILIEKQRLETSLYLRNILMMAIPLLMKISEYALKFTNYVQEKVGPTYNKINSYISPITTGINIANDLGIAKTITGSLPAGMLGKKQEGGYHR